MSFAQRTVLITTVTTACLTVLLLIACSGQYYGSESTSDSNGPMQQKYPPSQFITAVGISDKSTQDAELDAKRRVAEQIRSEISATTEDLMVEITTNTESEQYQKLVSEIQTKTNFGHAEMIKIDPALARKENGLFCAHAYISRSELLHVLGMEYEQNATTFRSAVSSLDALVNDPPTYIAQMRLAQDSFTDLGAKAAELRAVTQRVYEPFTSDLALFNLMEQKRVQLLQSIKITIEIEGQPDQEVREVVLMRLTTALTRLGIQAEPGVCGPQRYALRVKPIVDRNRGTFGPQCTLTMPGVLVQCATGRILAELNLSHPDFKGMHTKDENAALQAMLKNVTVERLMPMVIEGLSSTLPID